ncbi:MAG TPA: DUF885 domain-containing protein [Acidimicrobiia bacterium]|nr:DUF885 domain-containing protein [Acidimicrobiia bacterium]
MTSIDALAAEYWDLYLAVKPTYASLIGEHQHDAEIEDLSDPARRDHTSRLRALQDRVEKATAAEDPITHALLLSAIEADLAEEETEILVGPADPYNGPHSEQLRWAAQTRALEPAHAEALAQRYRQIPRLLDQALARHLRLASDGRPPAAATVRRVIDQIDAYLSGPLTEDVFVCLQVPKGWEGADSWRSNMAETVEETVRPGYASYRRALGERLLPLARPDDRPGICHIDDGAYIYHRLVERFVTIPYDPADIHRIGTEHATGSLVSEYAEIGQAAFGITDPDAIFERLRTDPALRYSNEEEMLAHAEEVVARAWAAIDGWLGARPDGPCRVLPVPASLAKDSPPAYYMQASPDGARPGTYFLNTYQPTTRDRFSAEDTAFHEAIPGHHFYRALASALTDLPDFRRFRSQNVHAEGWGLYAERLADEMGLYSGPVDRLGMLAADSWRAGRLVVDTGMHHHGWTRDQAVQFLVDWTPINLPTIEQEIDRYIGWPGQALSYKMGQIEIIRLRTVAERTMGSAFDIVGFHDTLLTSGSVTIPVLEHLVTTWMARVQRQSG